MSVYPIDPVDKAGRISTEPLTHCKRESELNLMNSISPIIKSNKTLSPDEEENETYEVSYHTRAALVTLSIHICNMILGPIALPFLALVYSRILLENMNFTVKNKFYYILEAGPWLWSIFATVMICTKPSESTWLITITTAIPIIFRNVLVSLKYGYYTHRYWKKINTKLKTEKENRHSHIVGSWMEIPNEIIERELAFAYKRQSVTTHKLPLKFVNMSETFKKFVLDFMENPIEIEAFTFPMVFLSKFFVRYAVHESKFSVKKHLRMLSVLYSLIPLLLILYRSTEFDLEVHEWVFLSISAIYSYVFVWQILLFIIIGVYDFYRKKLLMNYCTSIICSVETKYFSIDDKFPRLDTEDIKSVLGWYYIRNALLDFGKRFTLRIYLYISLIIPIWVGLVLIIVLMTFEVIDSTYLVYYIPGVFLTFSIMMIVIYMISAAISLNGYFAVHRDILLKHIAELRKRQAHGQEVQEDTVITLWVVIEKLNQDEVLHPVRIMGIALDSSLYPQIGAILLSGLFALIKLAFF